MKNTDTLDININSSKRQILPTGIAIFFMTLQSYYFYNLRIAPFPIIGAILFSILGYNKKFNRKIIKFCFLLGSLFFFSSLWGFFNKLDFIYWNSIIGSFLSLFFLFFFARTLSMFTSQDLSYIFKYVILIHFSIFIVQFVGYYIFNTIVDFLEPVTGEQSRFFFGGALTGIIRCTGLFNEPATYSYFVGGLVYLRLILNKKFDLLSVLGMLSIALTLSMSGIILAIVILMYYTFFVNRNIKNIVLFSIIAFFIVSIVFYFFTDTIYLYLFDRVSNISDDNSANTRFFDSFDFLSTRSYVVQLLGVGLGNYPKDISLTPSGIVGIISAFGFFGFICIMSMFYYFLKPKGFIHFLMFILFLFSTITLQTTFFWLFFSIFYYNEFYSQKHAR